MLNLISAHQICGFKASSFKKACTLLFLLFVFSGNVFGQNGVTITTTASNPSQNQNIPLKIKFDQPVNLFEANDVQVINGSLSNFNINVPDYRWLTSYNIDQFNIGIGDISNPEAKTNRVVISVASNSKGEIFVLTFGNGIYRIEPNGTKTRITNGSNLESPLDFAINNKNQFFVADNGQARQIKVFSPTGVYLPSENIGNGNAGSSKNNFYGPVGLTFDKQDNLYVADSYSGSDNSEFDRYSIKIYYSNGNYARLIRDTNANKEIVNPYRVAVDDEGNIYVSDSGGDNGRVIIFDRDLKYLDTLEGNSDKLGSPGSIVIDDYGYIYIADLGDEVSITQLLNAEEDPESLLEVFPLIRDGIKNDEFEINVYDSNRNYLKSISNKIDLPVDLGLDPCGKLLVNNAIFDGTIQVVFGFPIPDIDLDFDVEVYNRLPQTFTANLEITEECTPSKVQIANSVVNDLNCNPNSSGEFQIIWDETKPLISDCVLDKEVVLTNSGTFQLDNYTVSEQFIYNDNCDSLNELKITQSPSSGTILSNDTEVTLKVTDKAGNSEVCKFWIRTKQEEPTLDITCIGSKMIELLDDQAVNVSAKDFITGNTSGLSFNPSNFQFDCSDIGTQTITINAKDDATGATDSCTVDITVKDTGRPTIICPAETLTRSFSEGGTYEVEDFFESRVFDNCTPTDDLNLSQNPTAGTPLNEVRVYTIELKATDNFDNTETCTIKIDLSEESSPSFECPKSNEFNLIPLDDQCEYEVPDYTNSIRNPQNFDDLKVIQSYVKQEDFVTVTLEVYDGNTYIDKCIFSIFNKDVTAPKILNCSDLGDEVMITEGDTYPLENYKDLLEVEDCKSFEIKQNPQPGTPITENTEVTMTVTDNSGLTNTCTFTVEVTIVGENVLKVNCPGDYNIFADENCNYYVPDFSEIIETTIEEATITQSLEAGTIFNPNSDPYVTVTATFEDQTDSCEIYLFPMDRTDPIIECPANEMIQADTYTIPDYTETVVASDNCGEVTVTQQPVSSTVINEDATVVLTATDASGNVTECEIRINLVKDGEVEINCPENKIDTFNEDCIFKLPDYTSEADIVNVEGLKVTQDPQPGTVITTSEVEVTLSAEDNQESYSCTFKVYLEDKIAPNLKLRDISVDLNEEEGTASINFEDIDNGSYDNCDPDFTSRLNKSVFSCKNLGMNTIEVTAIDSNGNVSSAVVTITVFDPFGVCGEAEGSEYIFIYPNPNTGNFKVATPPGKKIQRIEVFDHRGRFINAKDYDDSVSEYAMDLGPLQEAVYVVKIVTNERTLTKRMIFKY